MSNDWAFPPPFEQTLTSFQIQHLNLDLGSTTCSASASAFKNNNDKSNPKHQCKVLKDLVNCLEENYSANSLKKTPNEEAVNLGRIRDSLFVTLWEIYCDELEGAVEGSYACYNGLTSVKEHKEKTAVPAAVTIAPKLGACSVTDSQLNSIEHVVKKACGDKAFYVILKLVQIYLQHQQALEFDGEMPEDCKLLVERSRAFNAAGFVKVDFCIIGLLSTVKLMREEFAKKIFLPRKIYSEVFSFLSRAQLVKLESVSYVFKSICERNFQLAPYHIIQKECCFSGDFVIIQICSEVFVHIKVASYSKLPLYLRFATVQFFGDHRLERGYLSNDVVQTLESSKHVFKHSLAIFTFCETLDKYVEEEQINLFYELFRDVVHAEVICIESLDKLFCPIRDCFFSLPTIRNCSELQIYSLPSPKGAKMSLCEHMKMFKLLDWLHGVGRKSGVKEKRRLTLDNWIPLTAINHLKQGLKQRFINAVDTSPYIVYITGSKTTLLGEQLMRNRLTKENLTFTKKVDSEKCQLIIERAYKELPEEDSKKNIYIFAQSFADLSLCSF